jgi:hypothetical protein
MEYKLLPIDLLLHRVTIRQSLLQRLIQDILIHEQQLPCFFLEELHWKGAVTIARSFEEYVSEARCLPSLEEIKVDGAAQVAITYDRVEILDFLKRDFVSMNEMCQRAEMFEERVFNRTQQVFNYFGLPFQTGQAQAKT